ncbi:unnamed protein product [Rotaria sordida]|uniref:Alpha-amylase n=1 Tax=Rotaria sordida TaxID=392033 RepID=A0A819CSU2_9BILA|nr:unnamed protein product [Rotaria sordida]
MSFNTESCQYEKRVTGLPINTGYEWKVAFNGQWGGDKGCNGGANCYFNSGSTGIVILIYDPYNSQLSSQAISAICGNNACETGETCRNCLNDCGQCPPAVCGDGKCENDETCSSCIIDCGQCPICGDGICQTNENFQTCAQDCPNELPGCNIFNEEFCPGGQQGQQFHANADVNDKRWQTPKPGTSGYQSSFQDYHTLVGYADIIYTSADRLSADVCLEAKHRYPATVTLTYYFDGVAQMTKCKHYTAAYTGILSTMIIGNDGSSLELPETDLLWNAKPVLHRIGDYRNGQKGAVAELFGWPHRDVKEECQFLATAGYLGVKLFPVQEQLMSTQPFENSMNPWYFMYQPVSYKLEGRMGTREELRDLINTCRGLGVRVYIDAVLNHFTGAGNDLNQHRNPVGCVKWGNKTTSASVDRQSPFYTHAYTYQYNRNTGKSPSNEYPGAALGPEDFHCDRPVNSWGDLFILNNGWLVGLTDVDTSKDNVRERQAAYLVDMLSLGASGFRLDAAKHISPEDISAILKKVQTKMGGQLPDDFFVWLEIITAVDKIYHTVSMMLIGNTCLNALMSGFCILGTCLTTFKNDLKQTQFQDSFCIFRAYITYVSGGLFMNSLLLQAIHRYFTVIYQNRLYFQSIRFKLLLICLTWIVALLYPIPTIFTGDIHYEISTSLIIFIYFKLVRYVHKMSNRVTLVNTLSRAKKELKMVQHTVILVAILVILGFLYVIFILISFFTNPPKYHFRIAYVFIDVSLVFVLMALFQFTEPVKASKLRRINRRLNMIAAIT